VDTTTLVPPGDVSLRWSSDGRTLYSALLDPTQPILTLVVSKTSDPFGPGNFVPVYRVSHVDQPDMEILGSPKGDHILVGANFMTQNDGKDPVSPGTASVVVIGQLNASHSSSRVEPIERRTISGQNYATRIATHPSGKVYALFYSPRPSKDSDAFVREDVVVVRDDSGGTGSTPFAALRDLPVADSSSACNGHDGRPGIRVVACRLVPWNALADTAFGQQRRVSANLSIAVDPEQAKTVWISWADSTDTNHYLLHVRRSLDAGATWSGDLLTIPNATNPALAVGSGGRTAFLFQQFEGPTTNRRWVTRVHVSRDGFATKRTYVLSTALADSLRATFNPYIGDYIELRAAGSTFYGVFSANNRPDSLNFPNGVSYQRNADFFGHFLLNARGDATIGYSIDPFFFSIGPNEHPSCVALRASLASAQPDAAATTLARMATIGCDAP
jgi:hypothetical protein